MSERDQIMMSNPEVERLKNCYRRHMATDKFAAGRKAIENLIRDGATREDILEAVFTSVDPATRDDPQRAMIDPDLSVWSEVLAEEVGRLVRGLGERWP